MSKVLAQGVFDIIHPGHIHYLQKSREEGKNLTVVIARDKRIKEEKNLVFNEEERKKIVNSLEMVDKAILGSEKDIYETVRKVNPDIITLGYDQEYEEKKVKEMAEKATGEQVEIKRITGYKDYSSSKLKRIKE